jgi:predicted Zn-dependent protease
MNLRAGILDWRCWRTSMGGKGTGTEFLAQARDLEARQGKISDYAYALAYLGLGQTDEAIAALERSYQARESVAVSNFRVDPILDPLRGNPRFEALVQKIKGGK